MKDNIYLKYLFEEDDSSPEESCIAAVKDAFAESKSMSKSEIKSAVSADEDNDFSDDYVEQIIGDLIRRGEIVPLENGKYELRGVQ